jgi:hypothetical protein
MSGVAALRTRIVRMRFTTARSARSVSSRSTFAAACCAAPAGRPVLSSPQHCNKPANAAR